MKLKIDASMHRQDKMYGTTTIGAKGQVVIPAEARKDLNLKPGDRLLVIGKLGKMVGLVKAEELQGLINMIMESVLDKKGKEEIKKHLANLLGPSVLPKKFNKQ